MYSTYFGKVILLIVLSIFSFFGFRSILPERIFPEQTVANNNIVVDSMMIEAVADTTSTLGVQDENNIAEDTEIDESFNPSLNKDGYQNLKHFYSKLYNLEKKKEGKVRIAYYGDSMNDGDYIVQDVRQQFQEQYGGKGVGFVAITSLSAGARGSISHQFSKNWTTQSFVKIKKLKKPFGIDGQVFFAQSGSAWVKYKAQQSQKNSTMLYNPTLFYGKVDTTNAYVSIKADEDSIITKKLASEKLLNKLTVSSTASSLKVDFNKTDSLPIYGFNFDDGQGVHVDNFSIRGNSGLPLSILNPSLMNAFDKELHYDLIVLHYGANVLGYGSLNYGWYEKAMTKVVDNLRNCFPNADILIISTADKASKIDGVMQTDSAVVPLSKAQMNYARKTSSGYINLYQLMGGKGSMVKWVNDGLAGKDYTHFNGKGSKRIAGMIYDEINKGYLLYKKEQETER